jgi:FtsH-binding integral membrane protein
MTMYPDQSRRVELDYSTEDRATFNFFNAVYAWMAVGLAVTGVVGFLVAHSSTALHFVYANRGVYLLLALGAMVVAWTVQSAAMRISAAAGLALFLLYAGIIGMLLSGVFLVYPAVTLGAAFVVTGGAFAATSIYGFVTKRDLTSIGSICIMLFFGLFLASIVNMFLANSALDWIITYGVLVVVIGIIAYRTQMLKQFATENAHNRDAASRMAVVGSLILYVAFINLFLSVLRILGDRR